MLPVVATPLSIQFAIFSTFSPSHSLSLCLALYILYCVYLRLSKCLAAHCDTIILTTYVGIAVNCLCNVRHHYTTTQYYTNPIAALVCSNLSFFTVSATSCLNFPWIYISKTSVPRKTHVTRAYISIPIDNPWFTHYGHSHYCLFCYSWLTPRTIKLNESSCNLIICIIIPYITAAVVVVVIIVQKLKHTHTHSVNETKQNSFPHLSLCCCCCWCPDLLSSDTAHLNIAFLFYSSIPLHNIHICHLTTIGYTLLWTCVHQPTQPLLLGNGLIITWINII